VGVTIFVVQGGIEKGIEKEGMLRSLRKKEASLLKNCGGKRKRLETGTIKKEFFENLAKKMR